MDYVDDALVDMIWKDLDGQVSRQQIAGAVTQIAARFEEATVTAFVPIFIRRQALEYLKRDCISKSDPVISRASTDDGDRQELGFPAW
jgi:dsDNA-specific endonuclease/ATPase MutS2